jgi:hypothetical protein
MLRKAKGHLTKIVLFSTQIPARLAVENTVAEETFVTPPAAPNLFQLCLYNEINQSFGE